jgi:hypothetical protein
MPRAYVLLNITPGTEEQVLKDVRKTMCGGSLPFIWCL